MLLHFSEVKRFSTLQNESNKVTPTQLTCITKELEEVKSVLNFDLKSEYGCSNPNFFTATSSYSEMIFCLILPHAIVKSASSAECPTLYFITV